MITHKMLEVLVLVGYEETRYYRYFPCAISEIALNPDEKILRSRVIYRLVSRESAEMHKLGLI